MAYTADTEHHNLLHYG